MDPRNYMPPKSGIIKYPGIVGIPNPPLNPLGEPYAGLPAIVTRFVLGKDFESSGLPEGTSEVMEMLILRGYSSIVNGENRDALLIWPSPDSVDIEKQVVRCQKVNYTTPHGFWDRLEKYDENGNGVFRLDSGGSFVAQPIFRDLLVQEFTYDERVDLSELLGIQERDMRTGIQDSR